MRTLAIVVLCAACTNEGTLTEIVEPVPSIAARYSPVPEDHVVITLEDPGLDTCVGLVLRHGVDDGIPGIDVSYPDQWGPELTFRRRTAERCHEREVQESGADADWATGYVYWEVGEPGEPPRTLEIDLTLSFLVRPKEHDLFDPDLFVEWP